jgi:hypothetical protein
MPGKCTRKTLVGIEDKVKSHVNNFDILLP